MAVALHPTVVVPEAVADTLAEVVVQAPVAADVIDPCDLFFKIC